MRVLYDNGVEGVFVDWRDHLLTLTCSIAYAPGAPLRATLAMPGGDLGIQSRVIGSKKRDDGLFNVRMRMINLRREDRARLDALVLPASDSP